MVRTALIVVIVVMSLSVSAQQKAAKQPVKKAVHKRSYSVVEAPPPPQVYTHVEQAPEFIGGNVALNKYLDNALRYPDRAREYGITGRVIVRFMVDEEGKITNAKVVKGIGYGCDEEALRVVKAIPAWRPAKYDGQRRRAMFILPINFKIT